MNPGDVLGTSEIEGVALAEVDRRSEFVDVRSARPARPVDSSDEHDAGEDRTGAGRSSRDLGELVHTPEPTAIGTRSAPRPWWAS